MSDAMLAPLSTLWSAMSPARPAVTPPVDVGAIAAAAEAQGFARGRDEVDAALAPAFTTLAAAVAALDAALVIDPATLQPLFVDLVTRIASAVVGGELRQSGDAVERLVAEALGAVEGGSEATLHLSADDASFFRHPRLRGDDGEDSGSDLPRIVIDPDLAPGEIRVETATHVFAASLDARLAAIVGAL
ncbi:hypothetical protein KX816_08850 [Sphingosinicellaceae bacterium]|nr:hypothetical protein KX816_08850 [Sphingosinicellaceae bacterium]